MKNICCILLLLATPFASLAEDANEAGYPRSTIEKMNQLVIQIVDVCQSGKVTVEMINSGKDWLKIWEDWNSWGAMQWRVFHLRNGKLETFYQNPLQGFTKNGPTFFEIAGGAHIYKELDLNGGNWCGFGDCVKSGKKDLAGQKVTFQPNDMLVVSYDVPWTDEAIKEGVWFGVAGAVITVQSDNLLSEAECDKNTRSREQASDPKGYVMTVAEARVAGITKTPEGYVAVLLGSDRKASFAPPGFQLSDGEVLEVNADHVVFLQHNKGQPSLSKKVIKKLHD